MYLTIPFTRYNEDLDFEEDGEIDLNPFHIVSIESHTELKNRCLITLINGEIIDAALSRSRTKKKIEDFVRESVWSKVYKDTRSQGN
jgi:hypothetical protein